MFRECLTAIRLGRFGGLFFRSIQAGTSRILRGCGRKPIAQRHSRNTRAPEWEITPTSVNNLGSRKEFELDKDVISEFCEFAVKFFENVEDPKPRN